MRALMQKDMPSRKNGAERRRDDNAYPNGNLTIRLEQLPTRLFLLAAAAFDGAVATSVILEVAAGKPLSRRLIR
jgi:hypothetical protein